MSSVTGEGEPDLEPVRPQNRRAALCQQESGKWLESGLMSLFTGSEIWKGAIKSILGSLLYLDHQVSLYSWTGKEERHKYKVSLPVFFHYILLTLKQKQPAGGQTQVDP